MLKTLKKFFAFCGVDNRRMFIASIWLGVVSAICSAMRIPATAIVIQALLTKNVTMPTLWTSLGIIVISTNPIIWGCILCVFIGKIFAILLMFHLLFSAVNFLSIKIVS